MLCILYSTNQVNWPLQSQLSRIATAIKPVLLVYQLCLSSFSHLSSLEWKRKSMLILLLLLPELNITSAISATGNSTSLPVRVVDGPAPPPPPPPRTLMLLLPPPLRPKYSIESHVLRGTEGDCAGWVVMIWVISWVMSAAAAAGGGTDGAVDDMWHVCSPRYVTSNV
jgi:hypothetical protein